MDDMYCINCGRRMRARLKAENVTDEPEVGRMSPSPGEHFPFCSSQCFAKWVYDTLIAAFPEKEYCTSCGSVQMRGGKYCFWCGAKGILPEEDFKRFLKDKQAKFKQEEEERHKQDDVTRARVKDLQEIMKDYQGVPLVGEEIYAMVELEHAVGKPIPFLLKMENETFGFMGTNWHVTGLALCDIRLHLVPGSIWALPQLKQLVVKRDQISNIPARQKDIVKQQMADLERRKCTITRLL